MIKIENIKLAKASDVENLQTNKVDKVEGKGLSTHDYTAVDKDKLSGIESGANNYTHPSNHDASMITESTSRRFVSDTEKTTWNAKIGNHGSIIIERIAVIQNGGSTTGIPNNTLILELE